MQRRRKIVIWCLGAVTLRSYAQFEGPGAQGRVSTVANARSHARLGSYVTLTGNVVNHLRDDYYTFKDHTGEIRVEISARVFRDQKVTPSSKIRITGEVEGGVWGRYIDVTKLELA